MSTVFTKIIDGELPGRFVWRDERAVGFLTIAPLTPGHTLVVPIEETDQWTDTPDDLLMHLMWVAREIGRAQKRVWDPPRVGLLVAGFEVPHLHLHVAPTWSLADYDFARVDHDPRPEDLDDAMHKLRTALRELGHEEHVPE